MLRLVKYILPLVFIVCWSQVVHAQTQFKNEDELIKNANKLFDNQEYVAALPLFSQLFSTHQSDATYGFKFGVCLLYGDRRDVKKPIKYLEQSLVKLPSETDVHYFLGIAYHQNYRFYEAMEQYKLYKQKAGGTKKIDVDRLIQMCENGVTLLSSIKDLYVLEKKEINTKDYFRSYNEQGFGGKFLVKPEEFKSKVDKKKTLIDVLFLSDTNKVIFFSSYGETSSGSKDIFMARKLSGGTWGVPQSLGTPVNTEFDEDYPFLMADGRTLFFCSKGHNSMGGYDVFKSEYDSLESTWSLPINMDYAINTPFDDILFATNASQEYAMFSSNRSSVEGLTTVYKVRIDVRPKEQYDLKVMPLAGNVKDPEYLKTIDFLATKDELVVNASPSQFDETEQEPLQTNQPPAEAVAVAPATSETQPAEPTEEISNAEILQEFLDQKKEIDAELNNYKRQAIATKEIADVKLKEAEQKQAEATAIEAKAKSLTNINEQQFQLSMANRMKSEASQLRKEYEVAAQQVSTLNAKAAQKQKESEQATIITEQAIKAVESGADVDTLLASMNKLAEETESVSSSEVTAVTPESLETPLPEEPILTTAPEETTAKVEEATIVTAPVETAEDQPEVKAQAVTIAKTNVDKLKQQKVQQDKLVKEATVIAQTKEELAIKKQVDKEILAEEVAALPEGPKKQQKSSELVKMDKEVKQLQLDAVVAKTVASTYQTKSNDMQEEIGDYETVIKEVEAGTTEVSGLTVISAIPEQQEQLPTLETAIADARQQAIVNRQQAAVKAEQENNTQLAQSLKEEASLLEGKPIVVANVTPPQEEPLVTEQEQTPAIAVTTNTSNDITKETVETQTEIAVNEPKETLSLPEKNEVINPTTEEQPVPVELAEQTAPATVITETPKQPQPAPTTPIKTADPVTQKQIDKLIAEESSNKNKYENNKRKIEKIRSMDLGYDEESYAVLDQKSVIWDEQAQYYFGKAAELRRQADLVQNPDEKKQLLAKATIVEDQALEAQKEIFIAYKTNDTTRLPKPEPVEKIIARQNVYDTAYTASQKSNQKLEKVMEKKNASLTDKVYKKQYNTAMDLIASQKYDQASQLIRELMKKDSSNPNLNFHLGFCVINTSMVKTKAQSYFEKASKQVDINYSNYYLQLSAPIYTYYYLGLVYQFNGDYQRAIDSYKKFKSFINDRNISEFEEILTDLNWQIQLCERALMKPGEALADGQKKDKKIESNLERKAAISVTPDNKEKLFKEALSYFNIGDYENATAIFKSLYEKDKENANLNYYVGASYLNLFTDKTKAYPYSKFAVEHMNKAYKNGPAEKGAPSKALYCMGTIYQYMDSCQLSTKNYDAYLATLNSKKDADIIKDVNWQKELCANSLRLAREKAEKVRRDSILLAEAAMAEELAKMPQPTIEEEVVVAQPETIPESSPIAEETESLVAQNQPQPEPEVKSPVVSQPEQAIAPTMPATPKEIITAKPEPLPIKPTVAVATPSPKPLTTNMPDEQDEVVDDDIKTIKYNTVKIPQPVFADNFIATAGDPAGKVSTYNNQNPIPVDVKLPEGLIYKVQIGSFKRQIVQDAFPGIKPIVGETTTLPGYTRYIAGNFTQKNDATRAQTQIKELGYTDAFVVAYYNGRRITIAQAEQYAAGVAQPIAAAGNQPQGQLPRTTESNDVFFTVQVGYLNAQETPARFERLDPLYRELLNNGNMRYAAGVFISPERAVEATGRIRRAGWADAFPTAYYKGERISIAQARALIASGEGRINTDYARDVTIAGLGAISTQQQLATPINPVVNPADRIENDIRDRGRFFFTVQIASGRNKLGAERLRGISPVFYEPLQNGMIRHFSGVFSSSADAQRERNRIVALGIADAFTTAYFNSGRISVADANRLLGSGEQIDMQTTTFVEPVKPITYKIQLGVFNTKASEETINLYKQQAGTDLSYYINEQGQYVYTFGTYTDIATAQQEQVRIAASLENTEVIAFRGSVKMTIEKAQELQRQ